MSRMWLGSFSDEVWVSSFSVSCFCGRVLLSGFVVFSFFFFLLFSVGLSLSPFLIGLFSSFSSFFCFVFFSDCVLMSGFAVFLFLFSLLFSVDLSLSPFLIGLFSSFSSFSVLLSGGL